MKESTLTTPVSTTDLMTYDGEYKTDFDKFRDMSGLAQGAIIAAGVVTVAAVGYGIYKGVQYIKDSRTPVNPYYNYMYPQQQYQYPQQYYQNPMQQSAVNIQGQYATNDNNQPTLTFQANSTPVQQPQFTQQPVQQQFYRVPTANGQVQDIPITPQVQSPIYQQPIQPQQ